MQEKAELNQNQTRGAVNRAQQPILRTVALNFTLGLIAAMALPPIGLWPCLLAFAISFAFARDMNMRRISIAGFSLGLGYLAAALHWIGFAFLVDAEAFLWMMPFAVGGLSAFLALYWMLAFMAARLLMRWRVPWFAAFPSSLAVTEVLRGMLFTGFPWAAPGLAVEEMGGVMQSASLIGMQGLTFWVLLWPSLALALVLRHITQRSGIIVAGLLLFLLPLAYLWGEKRATDLAEKLVPGVELLLVQPNVAQNDKWLNDNAGAIFEQLLALSTSDTATHIIWPESAVPFLLDESEAAKARIATQLKAGQMLMTGAVRRQEREDGSEEFFTSVLVFDDAGSVLKAYDKWRLVPGGEFLPLAWLLEPLGFRKVVNVPESFSAGAGPQSLDLGTSGLAGFLICYEVIFPQNLVDDNLRPSWLVNVTNDGWFGQSTGPHQHLAQARLRAVEQNLPLIRAANTGISAIIDGKGRIIAQTKLGEMATLTGGLPMAGEKTPFARFGLWLSFLSALMAVLSVTYLSNKPLNTRTDSF